MPTIKEEEKEEEEEEKKKPAPVHIIKPTTMTASDILTMDTMMNMEAYTKYLKRKQLTSGIKDQNDLVERKFYRRRILDLTKEMFRGGGHRAEKGININSTGVESAFDAYIRACIMHFKFIDLADVLQTEYADMPAAPAATTMSPETAAVDEDTISDFNKLCFNQNQNTKKLVKIRAPTSNALEMLFIPPSSTAPARTSATTTTATTTTTIVNDSGVSIPKTRDVNLMDDRFKMKGIKSRLKKTE